MSEWIKLTERLPNKEDYGESWRVLVVSDIGRMKVARIDWLKLEIAGKVKGNNLGKITHWMPLPEPPKL